ncbi:MAG: replication-associated recombination protein A [Microscillaceae bacterium]|nr:replication-associated recombination protein A [Microscillaceae bacterium]
MELFNTQNNLPPLAERLRPDALEKVIGQRHLIGEGAIFSQIVASGKIPSMIFWGPPGVGKTTLARIIGKQLNRAFFTLSAISSGVKEVREVIEKAKYKPGSILFIDEIHRFNKAQQDALLGAVEDGTIVLIGATTENPSFEVISALLSRCQVYILKSLEREDLLNLLSFAIQNDEILKNKRIVLQETEALLNLSGGDARKLLNIFELVINSINQEIATVTDQAVQQVVQQKTVLYDKNGEQHYDIISAFIKSLRGSDPNAAIYYLARMIEGGEDPKFIARRMLILASEDIGNANPTALVLATNCFQAVNVIGYPEARIVLSQTAAYLASSPKSNASYVAIEQALDLVRKTGDLPVPMHLRNAPTALMKKTGYGKDYQYAHEFVNNFIFQEYMPDDIAGTKFYEPGQNARENELRQYLKRLWQEKYGY